MKKQLRSPRKLMIEKSNLRVVAPPALEEVRGGHVQPEKKYIKHDRFEY